VYSCIGSILAVRETGVRVRFPVRLPQPSACPPESAL